MPCSTYQFAFFDHIRWPMLHFPVTSGPRHGGGGFPQGQQGSPDALIQILKTHIQTNQCATAVIRKQVEFFWFNTFLSLLGGYVVKSQHEPGPI